MFWVFSKLIDNRMLLFGTLSSDISILKKWHLWQLLPSDIHKHRENSDVTLCFCILYGNQHNNLLAITIRTILITPRRKLCVFITCFLDFSFLMEFCYESFNPSGECKVMADTSWHLGPELSRINSHDCSISIIISWVHLLHFYKVKNTQESDCPSICMEVIVCFLDQCQIPD